MKTTYQILDHNGGLIVDGYDLKQTILDAEMFLTTQREQDGEYGDFSDEYTLITMDANGNETESVVDLFIETQHTFSNKQEHGAWGTL